MFSKLGTLIFCIGVMSADSIDIMIPIMMVLSGMLLVAIDELVRGSKDE